MRTCEKCDIFLTIFNLKKIHEILKKFLKRILNFSTVFQLFINFVSLLNTFLSKIFKFKYYISTSCVNCSRRLHIFSKEIHLLYVGTYLHLGTLCSESFYREILHFFVTLILEFFYNLEYRLLQFDSISVKVEVDSFLCNGIFLCTLLYKIPPKLFFPNDKLDAILKRRNIEICEHSSFFNY